MSRRELVALFPDGKTLHVPSDGKPLPGFNQALASYQARKKSGNVAVASLGKSIQRFVALGRPARGLLRWRRWRRRRRRQQRGRPSPRSDDVGSSAAARRSGGQADQAAKADAGRQGRRSRGKALKTDNKIRILPPELANPVDLPPSRSPKRSLPRLPDARRAAAAGGAAPAGRCRRRRPDRHGRALRGARPASRPADGRAGRGWQEVALNIPLPMPRPGNAPPPELDANAHGPRRLQSLPRHAQLRRFGPPATWTVPLPRSGGRRRGRRDRAADELAPMHRGRRRAGRGRRRLHRRFGAGSRIGQRRLPDFARGDHSRGEGDGPDDDSAMPRRRAPRWSTALPGTDPASAVSSGVKTTAKGARRCARMPSATPSRRSSPRSRRPRAGRSTAPTCLPRTRKAPRL